MRKPEQFELPLSLSFAAGPAGPDCGRWRGVEITADLAECASGVPDILARAGASVARARLPAGDYLVGHRVLVERKGAGDFAASLYDGRLFRQLRYLKETELSSLLVVEGNPAFFERFWPPPLRTVLLCAVVEFRVPVLFTRGPEGTATLLLTLGKRAMAVHREESYAPVPRRSRIFGRRARRLVAFRETLERIPGIGPRLALSLMGRFGDLSRLRRAGEAELAAVEGIGPQRAREIFKNLKAQP